MVIVTDSWLTTKTKAALVITSWKCQFYQSGFWTWTSCLYRKPYQDTPLSLPLVSIRQSRATGPTTPIDTANVIKKPAALMRRRHYGKGHWRQTQRPSHICLSKSLTQSLLICTERFILVETTNRMQIECNRMHQYFSPFVCLLKSYKKRVIASMKETDP